jgi:hypothetical protein
MRKISRQEMKSRAVNNVLGSLRIEKLKPSNLVIDGMSKSIIGKTTTSRLLKDAIRHHGKI